jgi:outer membrane lipoprotein SlyB
MKAVILSIFSIFLLTSCARDLSSDTYSENSTLNIALEGKIISIREVKIRESEKLQDSKMGMAIGGLAGGVSGTHLSNKTGSGQALAGVGGAMAGSLIGAVSQSALSRSSGMEYIVKIDQSQINAEYFSGSRQMRNSLEAIKATGIVTIIQAKEKKQEKIFAVGEEIAVIISPERTRIIAK